MEPSGRNRVANREAPKTAKQDETVAVGCDQLPVTFHGKEAVDGSSPSEGLKKPLQMSRFCLVRVARAGDKGRTGSHAVDFPA
jgi:hypothetical protein